MQDSCLILSLIKDKPYLHYIIIIFIRVCFTVPDFSIVFNCKNLELHFFYDTVPLWKIYNVQQTYFIIY